MLVGLLLAVLLVPGSSAFAVAPRANLADIQDEVMCVSCNVVLNVAESPQADATRREIQRLIDRGKDKAQIEAILVDEYGPRALALPDTKGFNLAAYLVPILVGVGLLGLVVVLAFRWSRRDDDADGAAAAGGPSLSDADTRRLDDDLARYET